MARRMLVVLGLLALSLLPVGIARAQPVPTPTPTPTPPAIVFPPFDPAACVAKPQHLLIFDMKSGWWSNDGADFHNLLLPRVVKDCANVDIEYYFLQHLDDVSVIPLPPGFGLPTLDNGIFGLLSFYPLRPGIQNDQFMQSTFPTRPWNEYSQVWILSGSDQDPTDVPTDHEFFTKLLAKYASAATPGQGVPGLFIGAGIGNRDHANRVLATFQLPELFQTHLTEIDTPSVGDGSLVKSLTQIRMGAELTPHSLFEGVQSIVDSVGINDQPYETDFFPVANNPFTLIGKNGKGEPSIGARETEARRFVIDAGMQRYYSLFSPTEVGTYRYLQNIIKYLAR